MLRVALAQINTIVGNLEGNYYKIVAHVCKAQSVGADLVVFPEMAITGYPPEDLLHKGHFVEDNLKVLKKLVKDTSNITAIVGFVDRDKQGNLYNAAAVIHNRQLKGVYHKNVLPNYSVFDEKRYFSSGQTKNIVALGKKILGVSICEDIWVEKGPCELQAKAGAKVLVNISCSPYHAGKGRVREKLLKAKARKHNAFILYNNLVGGQDELVFDGGSMMIDPKGKVVASAKQFEEDLVVADIDIKSKAKLPKRRQIKLISIPQRQQKETRILIKGKVAKPLGLIEEIYKALVVGTQDYVQKNGFKKVVIGISGGIDSSIVAAIAAEAIGKENVIGLSMPSKFSSKGTKSDARKLAKNLGIRFMEIPIEKIFKTYQTEFRKKFTDHKFGVAEENLQARIRGNTLMTFSNKFGWLVLTTGNKSELAVGYCTLYGDMTGGFAVIKDVPKMKVYELAKFINRKKGHVIPKSVLKRPPTAELRKNQKDQDSLPPYGVLDSILKDYVEDHKSIAKITKRLNRRKLVEEIVGLVDRSEYKRRQAPPGIKITPRAFGKDWRLPITNKYKEFQF